mmetsp:Transcript_32308/g.72948  ORF Transcript_32308/g.72948 Transcript_32308/m.72948 type:complete len:262 (+) Transcript_32308:616-1401(+)
MSREPFEPFLKNRPRPPPCLSRSAWAAAWACWAAAAKFSANTPSMVVSKSPAASSSRHPSSRLASNLPSNSSASPIGSKSAPHKKPASRRPPSSFLPRIPRTTKLPRRVTRRLGGRRPPGPAAVGGEDESGDKVLRLEEDRSGGGGGKLESGGWEESLVAAGDSSVSTDRRASVCAASQTPISVARAPKGDAAHSTIKARRSSSDGPPPPPPPKAKPSLCWGLPRSRGRPNSPRGDAVLGGNSSPTSSSTALFSSIHCGHS